MVTLSRESVVFYIHQPAPYFISVTYILEVIPCAQLDYSFFFFFADINNSFRWLSHNLFNNILCVLRRWNRKPFYLCGERETAKQKWTSKLPPCHWSSSERYTEQDSALSLTRGSERIAAVDSILPARGCEQTDTGTDCVSFRYFCIIKGYQSVC